MFPMSYKSFLLVLSLVSMGCQSFAADTTNVGILVYSGVYNTEFVAPYDVFQHANAPDRPVKVFLVSPDDSKVVSAEGLVVEADYTFGEHPRIDILIVPSFKDYESDVQRNTKVIGWVRESAEKARYVLSNCWGAFYLAQAGLLDGRLAMTYPPDIAKLERQFPKLKAVYGKRFVRDGKFITGGGGVASYENALYVVEDLWDASLARRIASGLVLDWDLGGVEHFLKPPSTVPSGAPTAEKP